MDVLSDRQCFGLAVTVFGVSTAYSVFLWRRGFRRDEWANYLLLALAFGLTTVAMFQRGFSVNQCPVFNLFEATMFVLWALVLTLLILGLVPRLRFLGAFAAPVLLAVGIFALMPALDPPHGAKPEFRGGLPSLHVTMVLLAYGAFGLSCVAGVIYLTQDRNLKLNKARAIQSLLPSIQRLERIIGEAMFVGFLLLTLGLALGGVYLHLNRDKLPVGPDPKIVWSAFVWLMYLGLLIARWRFAPGGRRLAMGAVGVFAFIMLTFWGTNLLSPLHQS
ncbi:MAG: cytochrome c biogenesis protein [Verrucomicrobia bacterium]|nr:cytochrome c biogenesis protein [Verrucomicrobiota bacterium]